MAEREIERWVTWNGRRIPIYKGESKADVAKRLKEGAQKGKEKETTKQQDIKNRVAKKEALDKARKKSSQKGNAWANNPTERRKKSYEEATKNAQKAGEEFYERAMKGKVDAKFHKSIPADPARARKMQREAKEAEKANQPTEDFIKKLDKNGVAVTKDKELADKYAANKNPNFHFDVKKTEDGYEVKATKKSAEPEKKMTASERYRKSVQDLKKQARDLSDSDLDKKIKGASPKEARILQAEKDRRAKGGSNKDVGHGLREVKLANGKTMYKDQNGHWVKKEQAEKILGKKKGESEPAKAKSGEEPDSKYYKSKDFTEGQRYKIRGFYDDRRVIEGTYIKSVHRPDRGPDSEFKFGDEHHFKAKDGKTYVLNDIDFKKGVSATSVKELRAKKVAEKKAEFKFNAKERASYLNNISKLRNGGDRKNEDWRVARQMFDQAPTGTVMISKGERGSEFQYKKLADGSWEYMSGAYKGDKTDSKTISMGWAGRTGYSPSVEFTTEKAMKAKAEKVRSQAETKIKKAANLPNIKSNKSVLTRSGDKMYLDLDPSDMSPAKIKELEKKGWKRRGLSNDTWYYGG